MTHKELSEWAERMVEAVEGFLSEDSDIPCSDPDCSYCQLSVLVNKYKDMEKCHTINKDQQT